LADVAEVAIVVHGGAGEWRDEQRACTRDGLTAALAAGHAVLAEGGAALDAVQAAVAVLEDDPAFNAGRGSVRDATGAVRCDAAVMRGGDRAAGAVAGLRGVRHPILAARAVLEEGRHVLLTGEAARMGQEVVGDEWFDVDAPAGAGETVGAVARDAHGGLAAATSTGGTPGKDPGRVGDAPLPGAGTWADDATVAVSGTGDGEAIIRAALAHEVDALVRHAGLSVEEAAARALDGLAPYGTAGLIALGRDGFTLPFATRAMPRGWQVGEASAEVRT
jgi:isoaspartyl peptidase/L-asparaginase-like protein (Ntn-hydrolase superfamily)